MLIIIVLLPFMPMLYNNFIIDNTPVLEINKRLDFGDEQTSKTNIFLNKGWHNPEKGLTWSKGKASYLKFKIANKSDPVVLNMMVTPFADVKKLPIQHMNMYVNNTLVKSVDISSETTIKHYLPVTLLGKKVEVKLELPNAISPKELGVSNDDRTLGIALISISANTYQYGQRILFDETGKFHNFIDYGWHQREGSFAWMSGEASMIIPIQKVNNDVKLFVKGFPLMIAGSQTVEAVVNGVSVGNKNITEDDIQVLEYKIDKTLCDKEPLKIIFKMPNALRPIDYGVNKDERMLSFATQEIWLETEN